MTGAHRAASIPYTRRLRRSLVVLIVLGAAVALPGGRGGGAPLQASTTSTITRHAGSSTFQSGSASTASTAAPSDLRAGDVVISYLETTSSSGVLCQTSTKVLDQVRGAIRLAACLSRVGSTPPASFSASLTPAGPVAMVTLAFSGVDLQTPVDAQASSATGTSPSVRTTMANEVLVLGEGSNATAATATAPTGSTLVRSLNNGASAQVAVAVMGTGAAGMVGGKHWAVSPNGNKAAAATIALRPATSSATPTPTPTTPTTTTATATATGTATPTPTAVPPSTPTATPTPTPRTTTSPTPTRTPTPTPTPTGRACVTSDPSGNCGPYSYAPNTWSNGSNTYVGQDVWNPIPGWSQTLTAYDPGNFTVTANMPAGNTAVVSFPNSEQLPPCCSEPALSSFSSITSSFSESMPHNGGTSAWAAFDLWFNNWANEVMISHDYSGAGPCEYRAVTTFGGSNGVPVRTWGLCVYGSELIWKLAPIGSAVGSNATINEQSASVDILAMVTWLETHGYMQQRSTFTASGYGWEICSTGGVPETFRVSSFTFTLTAAGGGIVPSSSS